MVWNPTAASEPVPLTVCDATFVSADAPDPDALDPDAPLPPESLRLYRWRRATPHAGAGTS
jgi:hypothetical protein